MNPISRNPVYNLSAVIRETGLPADILRAWERRYHLPNPGRTSGGHRLYSDYDVATLRWLRARQAEGLSISRAVELWKKFSADGRDPLVEHAPSVVAPLIRPPGESNQIDQLRNEWLDACLAFDALAAENMLTQAFALYPLETVCVEILQKGLSEFGQRWYTGRSTVQQEHFAAALATRRVEALIAAAPPPTRAAAILVGCPAGEWHAFPALLLTLLLRRKGLNVIYLGANIPGDEIEQTCAAIRPTVVVLVAQQLTSAAALQTVGSLFQQLSIPLAYGGLVFNRIPALRGKIAAYFLGEDLAAAAGRVEQLTAAPTPFPTVTPVENSYTQTADVFSSRLALIEKRMTAQMSAAAWPGMTLAEINAFFAAGLSAALRLGDPTFLEPDLDWVKNLLLQRGLAADSLEEYLRAYQQSLREEMGLASEPIAGWLAAYLARYERGKHGKKTKN